MSETKIFVVAPSGTAAFDEPVLQYIDPDNAAGDSICHKRGYSELRAHYWVWKNIPDIERVGFFQFRRFLYLGAKETKRPYFIIKEPDAACFAAAGELEQYDVIAPLAEYTGESVMDHYAREHRACDMETVLSIIKRTQPEYYASAVRYLSGEAEYYCNMYIMRKDVFCAYCQWLFGILEEFDNAVSDAPPRTQGYLAERLFGIWFTQLKSAGDYSFREVPRVHFWCYDDKAHSLKKDKLKNLILPPGSKLRALVRKELKKERRKQ